MVASKAALSAASPTVSQAARAASLAAAASIRAASNVGISATHCAKSVISGSDATASACVVNPAKCNHAGTCARTSQSAIIVARFPRTSHLAVVPIKRGIRGRNGVTACHAHYSTARRSNGARTCRWLDRRRQDRSTTAHLRRRRQLPITFIAEWSACAPAASGGIDARRSTIPESIGLFICYPLVFGALAVSPSWLRRGIASARH
jgi:hypothetical protein